MRLSDVLSKEPNLEFQQVDGFLKKKLPCGGQQRLDVGVVCRAFYCKNCGSDLTFSMGDRAKIACIGVTNYLVSIDCVLKCPRCATTVPIWYLVESRNEVTDTTVWVRILKRTENFQRMFQFHMVHTENIRSIWIRRIGPLVMGLEQEQLST